MVVLPVLRPSHIAPMTPLDPLLAIFDALGSGNVSAAPDGTAVAAAAPIEVPGAKPHVAKLLDLWTLGRCDIAPGVSLKTDDPTPRVRVRPDSIEVALTEPPIVVWHGNAGAQGLSFSDVLNSPVMLTAKHPRFQQIHSLLSGRPTKFGTITATLPAQQPLGEWRRATTARVVSIQWQGATVSAGLFQKAALKGVVIRERDASIDLDNRLARWLGIDIDRLLVWGEGAAPAPKPASSAAATLAEDVLRSAASAGQNLVAIRQCLTAAVAWCATDALTYTTAVTADSPRASRIERRNARRQRQQAEEKLLRKMLAAQGLPPDVVDGVIEQESARFGWLRSIATFIGLIAPFVLPPQFSLAVKAAVWLAKLLLDRWAQNPAECASIGMSALQS